MVEDLLRTSAPQVLAAVARRYGDFDAAEDAVQEALLAASRQWPADGIPDNPVAWLIRVASRRLIEMVRNEQARRRREESLLQDPIAEVRGDDELTLLLLCCHPALTEPAQVALTLRAVGGLSTAEIARALLIPEKTVGQICGFTRSDADEVAVLHLLELSQDVRAQALDIACDPWPE